MIGMEEFMAKKNERTRTPGQIFRSQQLVEIQQNPLAGASGPVKTHAAKLEKELRDATGMVRLYEEEDQNNRIKIKDLEHRLTNTTVQLELTNGKQARFVRADQILVDLMSKEKDRTFAEELRIGEVDFSLSNLVAQIVAGDSKAAWDTIDTFRARVVSISTLITSLTKIADTAKIEAPNVLPVPTVTNTIIDKRVSEALEDKVRAISGDLYERSLSLPRIINTLYDRFVANRTRFQHLVNERDEVMDDLITRRIDAQLTPARSIVERSLPVVDVKALTTLSQIIQFGRIAQARLDEIDGELSVLIETFNTIRMEYHTHSASAAEIRIRAEEAKKMTSLFGLPCPAEIARQFNETIQRLLLVNIETDQGKRLQNMLAFQPHISDRASVIQNFFENLLATEAFMLRFQKTPPEDFFKDKPTHEEALTRLLLITADMINKPGAERFKAKNTIVSILQKSNLVQEEDETLKELADAQKHLFQIHHIAFYYVWEPLDSCRELAKSAASHLLQGAVILEAIKLGNRQHHAEKFAAKTGTTSETED